MAPHAEAQQSSNSTPGSKHPCAWIPVSEQALFTPKKMRVVTAGAGHAGMMIAYKMRHEIKVDDFVEHVIYEKNHDVGGTWLENRYPGVACDIPAHVYTYSWEPNPNWSSYYCTGEEIFQYIKNTAAKYDLTRDIVFNSKIVEAIWNESRGKWEIKIEQKGTIISDECEVFIDASGILNKWKWPSIEGLKSFKGHMVHSARWDDGYDFTGKRVAVIGNGSSAIQIVPELQKVAGQLTNYIRSPTWISAGFVADLTAGGKNFKYTEEQKAEFRNNPESLYRYRKEIENTLNHFFYALINDSPEHQYVTEMCNKIMRERLGGDEGLVKEFIPKWRVGCRRLTPGEGYLEALQAKNSSYIWTGIQKITEKGIVTVDGEETGFDAIICATGFDASFVPRWRLEGKNGKTLEPWAEDPAAYLGIHAPDIPNYFIINGPNCPIGNGSLLAVMEWTSEYILRWMKKLASEDIKSFVVKHDVLNEYNTYIQELMKRTVWSSGCNSWYKNGIAGGKVTVAYPSTVIHYKELIENIRGEDFEFIYNSINRFKFMGNGKAQMEMDPNADLSFYMYK